MKKTLCLLTAVLSLLFVSCSSDKKEIEPVSTQFTSGELAKYVELVDEPCEMTFSKKDGSLFETQYIRLKTRMKLVRKPHEVKYNTDFRDISFTGMFSVAVVELLDENDSRVMSLDVQSEDIKQLLTKEVGSTAEVVFVGEFHNADDAPGWFRSAVKFKPTLTGDIQVEAHDSSSSSSSYSSSLFASTAESASCDDDDDDDDDDDEETASSDSSDWDEVLDSYEEYVDKYIDFMQRAADGDLSAMTEYPALLEKAQEFGNKLSAAGNDLSYSQMSRYNEINTKMLEAAEKTR